VEIRGEVRGRIDAGDGAEPVRLGLKDRRAQLQLPEHVERPALVVVVEADEPHERRVLGLDGREHVLDEPLPVPAPNDVVLQRHVAPRPARREERCWRNRVGRAVGLKKLRHQLGSRARRVGQTMHAARGAQLVTTEPLEKIAEAKRPGRCERLDDRVLGPARRDLKIDLARDVDEPLLRQDSQDGAR